MKAKVYSKDGKEAKEITLPSCFNEEIREEIIRRAVLSDETKEYQPKGAYKFAGLETSAKYRGRKDAYGSLKNKGQAMLPREVRPKGLAGKVRRIPSAYSGRRAHPPKPEKIIIEKVNKKEYRKALFSAIAATAQPELIKARGHLYSGQAPIIFSDDVLSLSKTKDVLFLLSNFIGKDLSKAKQKRKKVTGIRKRKTRTKTPKSALIVIPKNTIFKAALNLPGVDVIPVNKLRVKDFAPGTHPGRLTIYTEKALFEVGDL